MQRKGKMLILRELPSEEMKRMYLLSALYKSSLLFLPERAAKAESRWVLPCKAARKRVVDSKVRP